MVERENGAKFARVFDQQSAYRGASKHQNVLVALVFLQKCPDLPFLCSFEANG